MWEGPRVSRGEEEWSLLNIADVLESFLDVGCEFLVHVFTEAALVPVLREGSGCG